MIGAKVEKTNDGFTIEFTHTYLLDFYKSRLDKLNIEVVKDYPEIIIELLKSAIQDAEYSYNHHKQMIFLDNWPKGVPYD